MSMKPWISIALWFKLICFVPWSFLYFNVYIKVEHIGKEKQHWIPGCRILTWKQKHENITALIFSLKVKFGCSPRSSKWFDLRLHYRCMNVCSAEWVQDSGCFRIIPAGSFQSTRWDTSDPGAAAGLSCSVSIGFPSDLQGSKRQLGKHSRKSYSSVQCTAFPREWQVMISGKRYGVFLHSWISQWSCAHRAAGGAPKQLQLHRPICVLCSDPFVFFLLYLVIYWVTETIKETFGFLVDTLQYRMCVEGVGGRGLARSG